MIKKWLEARQQKRWQKARDDGYEYAAHQLLIYQDDLGETARVRSEADGDYNLGEDWHFEFGMQLAVAAWDTHTQSIFEAGRRKGAEEVLKHGALSHEFHLPRADTHL